MHNDSAYTIFIIFGFIWIAIGATALILLFKSEGQPIRFGKWGLLVSIPVVIPIIAALVMAAIMSRS